MKTFKDFLDEKMTAAAKMKQAKYRKSAAGKKSAKAYKKKTSKAGYKVDKSRSKAAKKGAKLRKNEFDPIEESSVAGASQIPVEDDSANIADVANPAVLKKVNAFVGSIADREYLNANHAIAELRQKLARIGVSFGDVNLYEDEGEVSVPIAQWGGRYGKDTNTPYDEVINDDGVSHRVDGGLSINFKYMDLDNGSCKVFAAIA